VGVKYIIPKIYHYQNDKGLKHDGAFKAFLWCLMALVLAFPLRLTAGDGQIP